jgi:hypothetical protein
MKVKAADDPTRLEARAPVGSALEQGLGRARARGPSDQQLRELERRVLASIGAGPASTGTARPGAVRLAGATKLALTLTLGALTAGGAMVWHRSTPPLARRQAAPAAAPIPDVPPAVAPAPAPEAAPVVAAPPATAPTATLPASPKRRKVRAGDDGDELRLLARARRALADDPRLALSLAREHERRFPGGAMDQEREVIAVTALADLGEEAEARQRAERFAREHAGSAYLERIRAIVAEPEPQRR